MPPAVFRFPQASAQCPALSSRLQGRPPALVKQGMGPRAAHAEKAGVPPRQILDAATRANAEFFGLSRDFGTIEPGKRDSLLLLRADPLPWPARPHSTPSRSSSSEAWSCRDPASRCSRRSSLEIPPAADRRDRRGDERHRCRGRWQLRVPRHVHRPRGHRHHQAGHAGGGQSLPGAVQRCRDRARRRADGRVRVAVRTGPYPRRGCDRPAGADAGRPRASLPRVGGSPEPH
jgi:hypothetical protein